MWKFGSVEVWKCGSLEVWKFGSVEVWKFRSVEVWKCGSLEVWKCGSVEVLCSSTRSKSPNFGVASRETSYRVTKRYSIKAVLLQIV